MNINRLSVQCRSVEDTGLTGNKPAVPVVGKVRVNSMGPMQWCSRSPRLAAATSGLMPTPCRK